MAEPNPSDAFTPVVLSITQVVTLKLSDTNYLSWKLQFEQFLNSQLLLGYVTGATPYPPPTLTVRNGEEVTETNNPAYLKWIHTDQLIGMAHRFLDRRSSQEYLRSQLLTRDLVCSSKQIQQGLCYSSPRHSEKDTDNFQRFENPHSVSL